MRATGSNQLKKNADFSEKVSTEKRVGGDSKYHHFDGPLVHARSTAVHVVVMCALHAFCYETRKVVGIAAAVLLASHSTKG